ncbi:MAG: hypothetical protein ACKN9T_10785 [Candidatus Methylumidiphilus sp.]
MPAHRLCRIPRGQTIEPFAHLTRLDCKHDDIFDESRRSLQFSMRSICYDPMTGESLSEISTGKKLSALKVAETDGWVYLLEKKAVVS